MKEFHCYTLLYLPHLFHFASRTYPPLTTKERKYILMTKKFVSMFLALAMCLTLSTPALATENDPHLEEVKKSYIDDHCFYQITDTDYLNSLADGEVIEVFHGINVTKNLLNENMILDINKVTSNDIVKGTPSQRITKCGVKPLPLGMGI